MVRVVGIDALVTFHPRSPPQANDGNQRLAATRDPRHPIPSRVRCLASLAGCGQSDPPPDAAAGTREKPRLFQGAHTWKKVMDDFFHGQLGAFSLLLSADPVLLHDVRTLLDDAGEIALVYLKLESVCLE